MQEPHEHRSLKNQSSRFQIGHPQQTKTAFRGGIRFSGWGVQNVWHRTCRHHVMERLQG